MSATKAIPMRRRSMRASARTSPPRPNACSPVPRDSRTACCTRTPACGRCRTSRAARRAPSRAAISCADIEPRAACIRSSAASSRRIARSPRTCCASCAPSCRAVWRTHRRANGRCPILVALYEARNRLKRLGFLPAHVRQRVHGRMTYGGDRVAAAKVDGLFRRRSGHSLLDEDFFAVRVEHFDRKAVEPLAEIAVSPVVNRDRFDRHVGAEVDLPPRLPAQPKPSALLSVRRTPRSTRRQPA